jgi:hypothetical protein
MFKKFIPLCVLPWVVACSPSEDEIHYHLKSPVSVEVYTESVYSTLDLKDVEQVGTIAAAYINLSYSSVGDTLLLQRTFEIDKSRGYLKNSMPAELQWRLPAVTLKALDQKIVSLDGFQNYDSLLYRIPMPERWRKQLLNPNDVKHLERQEKHRWEMSHLLTGPVPTKGNITDLLKSRGRLNFALIRVDSVVTDGYHNIDSRKCLGYTVYLNEVESFPYYIWEQHVNSKIGTEKFQAYYQGLKADYSTAFWVTLDPATGIPCQEREVKTGINTMVNPTTGDSATFTSHVTLERLYTVVK